MDELYINAVFYGFALLITVLVQTIKGQLDLYHAIFMIHLLSSLAIFQFYGMSYVPMRIYRVLIKRETTGLRRFVWVKRLPFHLPFSVTTTFCATKIFVTTNLLYTITSSYSKH